MKPLNPQKGIILHPDILKVLPEFHHLIRDERYMDCISFVQGTHYMEIEAIVQPHYMATVKVLIPHHLILAIVDSPQKNIIGFDYKEPDKKDDSH